MAAALLRQAWRAIAARPLHAALVAGSMALGLAANAVVFAVVDATIIRPFPYPDPERLVGIGAAYPRLNRGLEFFESISGPEYAAIREGVGAFGAVTAFDLGNEPVMLGATPERVFTAYFFDDPFAVLGVTPASGRSITGGEFVDSAPVALVTARLARALGVEPDTMPGRTLRVGGRPHTVVGVIPPRVSLYDTDLWIPMPDRAGALPQHRRQFNVLARIASGRTIESADADLALVASRIAREHGTAHVEYADFRLQARRWTEVHAWGLGHIALLSFVGVGLLLALITANLANLLLARSVERAREMAVRTALGASRRMLAAQLLCETAMLASAGGAAGLLLAFVGVRAIAAGLGDFLPPGPVVEISGRLVAFVFGLSAAAALLVSLAPIARLARRETSTILSSETGRTTGAKGARVLQRAIVAAQIAIALIVTASAVLLAGNIRRALAVDPGFPHEDVMVMRVTLPLPKYDGRSMAFFDAVLERLGPLPNVASASVSNQPPPGLFSRAQFAIEGAPPADRLPAAFFTTAGPLYRETLGLELSRSRWFDERASHGGPREVVINEVAAQQFFPGEDPVGRRILISPPHSDERPTEIVGIVRTIRNRGLVPQPGAEIIGSVRQIPDRRQSQLYVVVRGRSGTAGLLDGVREAIAGLDPEQPVYAVSTLAAQFEAGVAGRRAAALLLNIFAAFALALASLGIYGVMMRAVLARTREIGIRAALGAGRGALRRMVIADALRPVAAGLALGLGALLAGQATLASWIYGVTPEPGSLAAAAAALLAVAALATLVPAWRASRIDPMVALRE